MAFLTHKLLRLAPCTVLWLSLALHMGSLNVDGAAPLMFGLRKRMNQVKTLPVTSSPSSISREGHRSALTSLNPAGYVTLGEYFISMSLGTPVQTFDAVIDTGSGAIHVPCAVPPDITPPVPTFNYSASTTLTQLHCGSNETRPNSTECGPICSYSNTRLRYVDCTCSDDLDQCNYSLRYGDGSGAHGFLFNDNVYFSDDNRTTARLDLGCATNFTTGMFEPLSPYFAGISWQEGSLLTQLSESGLTDDTFSMCLGDVGASGSWNSTNVSHQTDANGLLVLGTAPPLTSAVRQFVSTQAINYTAWNNDPSSKPRTIVPGLNLEMMSLTVGGALNATSSNLTNLMPPNTTYPALLDSGTSFALFPAALAVNLVHSLLPVFSAAATATNATLNSDDNTTEVMGFVITFPTATSPSQLDELLPPLVFQFSPSSPVTISVPPSRYMTLKVDDPYTPFTWTFAFTSGGTDHQVIMGNEVIHHWYIQATQSTLQVNISIVDSCNNLTFLSAPDASPPSSSTSPPGSTASGSSRRLMHADPGEQELSTAMPHDRRKDGQQYVRAGLRHPRSYRSRR